jgi:LysR family transcriptional regulator, hypochlorite-specific transcription factor HypT
LEIRWLQDFLTLVETGNFTRAAALRHASQAAFSRRIQQLEAWLGAPLIDRSMYPTKLTPKGEMFRRTASEMLMQVADARAEIAGRPALRPDHIKQALPHALATSHLPGWWSDWTTGHPLTADFALGNIHDLGHALMSGAADIMMCFESALQPIDLDPEQVYVITLGHDVMRPYASTKLAAGRGFRWPATEQPPAAWIS